MKKSVVLLLVVVLLFSLSLTASAKMKKTYVTGTNQVVGPPMWPPDCTYPDGNEHCRGIVLPTVTNMSDDRLDGNEVVTIGHNLRKDRSGPWWGTGVMTNAAGEITWTSKFEGQRNADGSATMHAISTGHGAYEGLKAFLDAVRLGDESTPFYFTGYVLEKD